MIKVKRYFLDLRLEKKLKEPLTLPNNVTIDLWDKRDFNLNKFFYKQIGKDHYWRDRLIWTDKQWLNYSSNKNLDTWVIQQDKNLIGFYEAEKHLEKNEIELINMGVLTEFREKRYGSVLLKHLIKEYTDKNFSRVWVHTCSLDHKYALQNYKSKGFKVFKEEKINYVA